VDESDVPGIGFRVSASVLVLNVLLCGAHNERGSSWAAALPAKLNASAIEVAKGVTAEQGLGSP
jgi:hypothetical protein